MENKLDQQTNIMTQVTGSSAPQPLEEIEPHKRSNNEPIPINGSNQKHDQKHKQKTKGEVKDNHSSKSRKSVLGK